MANTFAYGKKPTSSELPEFSAAEHPTTGETILIKRYERGYWPWSGDVNAFNAKRGVTPAQAEAMLIGSMFGWHVPGANPKEHEKS